MRTESEAIPRDALVSVRQAEARRREAIARRDAALRELAEAELLVSESQRLQAEAARSRAQMVQKRTDAARRHADTAHSADDHGTRRVAPAALAAPRHGSARARAQQAERDALLRDACEAESARDRAVAAPSRPSLRSEPDFSAAQRVWACDSDAATTDGASSSCREGPESEPTSLRLTLDINISGGAATALVNSSQKQCRCGGMRTHAMVNAEQSGRRAGTSVPIPIETWGAAEDLQSNEDSGAEVDLEDLAHDLDTLEIWDDGSRTPENSDAAEGLDTEDEESSSDSEDESNADSEDDSNADPEDESNADPEDESNASDDAPVAEAPKKRQQTHHSNSVRQRPSTVSRLSSKENVSSAQRRQSERQSREPAPQSSKRDADVRPDENDKMLRASIENAVMGEPPCVSWDDIAGLDGAKEALREAVILPAKFPNLFTGNLKPVSAILLYGPPGTGKTYLAKAVATESRSTFFSISTSDLVGHWHGESERLVRHLFSAAREAKPSVIFIDEIDALCGGRDASNSDTSRRMLTELLAQMNGVGKDQEGVLVLGATNTPWDLDPAVRRRFERRIYIPLPDAASRARMFKLNTDMMHTTLTSKDYKRLAEMTRGYSGADVAVAVKDALMQPIRKLQRATHFKKVAVPGCERRKLTPCGPRDKGAREMNWMDIREDKLLQPPPELEDFIRSVRNTRPTVNKKDLARQVSFTKEFGQDGV